jgi:formiminoglutamase
MVQVIDDQNNLEKSLNDTISKYVLIGIPEDIGVRANGGVGGADTAWLPFLQSFFNIQSNDFLLGDEVLVMGHFDLAIYNT